MQDGAMPNCDIFQCFKLMQICQNSKTNLGLKNEKKDLSVSPIAKKNFEIRHYICP